MEEIETPNVKKKVFLSIAVILVVIVGILMVVKASINKEARLNSQPVELVEGAEIPDIELVSMDGSKKDLSDLPHKVMLLNFWATWCHSCMEEMPSMVALRNKYASQGFEILGVNVDENPGKAIPQTISKYSITFPVFIDEKNKLSEIFDVHAVPLSIMINRDRKIVMFESGGREWDDDETHQLVEKLLKD
jgi:thiol-disulfide isomerase/thioredoxin